MDEGIAALDHSEWQFENNECFFQGFESPFDI
jgi:hypothetical protein